MRGVLVLVAALAVATAVEIKPLIGYHDAVGIPLAKKIYEAESAYFAKEIVEELPATEDVENVKELPATEDVENNEEPQPKIVGGVISATNAHPYLAGLVISFWNVAGNSACGSTLLTSNRLVTAAHCWFDGIRLARQYEVVLGSNWLFFGGTRIVTDSVFMHPAWNPAELENDVAMIYLPWNVPFSQSILPATLPSGSELFETFAGQWSMAAGFGITSDAETGITTNTQIREVNLQVITVQACRAVYGNIIKDSTLCTNGAGGVGICNGDSGGPLIINRSGRVVLVGVSSFAASRQCQAGHPSGFARVTSFMSFINQHL